MEQTMGGRWGEAWSSQGDGRARVQEGAQEKGTFRRWQVLGRDAGGVTEKADGETPRAETF